MDRANVQPYLPISCCKDQHETMQALVILIKSSRSHKNIIYIPMPLFIFGSTVAVSAEHTTCSHCAQLHCTGTCNDQGRLTVAPQQQGNVMRYRCDGDMLPCAASLHVACKTLNITDCPSYKLWKPQLIQMLPSEKCNTPLVQQEWLWSAASDPPTLPGRWVWSLGWRWVRWSCATLPEPQ